ncbi:hypothetical protein FHY55_03710 [Oceanicola sp. D3]|uniref:hypothetical protein n=1 Tax=Oceanicola sp. D3 TaxID=2587163 RepID=UPI00111D269F|nr:hypothetical protein [Oceanicola sp. D3]QDC08402.1 hypothetical protein FHY55_03710 [Oceanicola sp. D3]
MTGGSDTSAEEARAISQGVLDITGAAYSARDFAAYAPHFVVPGDVHAFGGVRLVKDLADLHDLFMDVAAYFDSIQVTALIRSCISAEFDGPDVIKATHITRMMSGTQLLAPPFPGFSLLRRIDGVWKVSSSQYATDDPKLINALARPAELG